MNLNEIQIARILDDARKYVEEEKYLHAAQFYHRLIRLEPGLMLSYVELASMYAEMGDLNAGINILHLAEERFPEQPDLLFRIGDYNLRLENYPVALRYFAQLEREHSAHVHYKMGVAYFFQDKLDNAEEQFRLAVKIDPNFPRVNDSIGELLLKRGAFQDAIRYLKKGITIDPYNGVSHFLLGIAHCRLQSWRAAYDEFVLSIDMDPQEALHWQLCGETLIHLDRLDEAEQYIRKALELDPQSVDSRIRLGHIHAMRGNYEAAREWLGKALYLDPKNERAQELLSIVRENQSGAGSNFKTRNAN